MVNVWDIETYPDEAGFKARMAGVVESCAADAYARRSQAPSACPDTGLPVFTWALEGEPVISPYTGRRYTQGPTGYFGPKARDAEGRITQFGGDALKYVLPAVTARLMLRPDDAEARAFVSIPGILNQHYHFAAVNWARFLGLVGGRMDPAWHTAFADAVASYRESRHPSDGARQFANPPRIPFDLVGEEQGVLGGNPANGGTENHKVMWRTSGLLYAELLGAQACVSGHPAPVAIERTTRVLRDFLQRLLLTGNGEYDSVTYYYYVLLGYLNLFDFTPSPETRLLARMSLDYYLATYGLKMFGGVLVGASKRGFSRGLQLAGTDLLLDGFCPSPCRPSGAAGRPSLHQATTRYRPNRILCNLMAKRVPLPFEARMARPSYHMDQANFAQETFYAHRDFALGSTTLTQSDNPGQQAVWSLAACAGDGPVVIGGSQPRFRSPEGHSPYDQVFQHGSCLVLITAATTAAGGRLERLPLGMTPSDRWAAASQAAETWLYVPRRAAALRVSDDLVLVDAGSAYIAVRSLGDVPFLLGTPAVAAHDADEDGPYDVAVFPGEPTGFVLEVEPAARHASLEAFEATVRACTSLDLRDFRASGRVIYRRLAGDTLDVTHDDHGLRCRAAVNGHPVDWDRWAGGNVYDSPYLKVGQGRMVVTDGHDGYEMRADSDTMAYRPV